MATTSGQIEAQGRFVDYQITYEDPALLPYEGRAAKRLNFVLEQVQLGEDVNLGYAKVTWLPDQFVRIRYLRMDGITQPIIVVRVEFQPGVTKEDVGFIHKTELPEELEDIVDPPPGGEPQYVPYCWIGIAAFEHALIGGVPGNQSAEYWGYPVDPRLVGFDPTTGGIGIIRNLTESVESFPGALTGGASWNERNGGGAQEFFQINDGQQWTMNQFAIDQGTFQDGDWALSSAGLCLASVGGMYAFEHCDVIATAPPEAYGSGLSRLPQNYWKRSIVIPTADGIELPRGVITEEFQLGGGTAATISANYSGGFLPGNPQNGRYEIGCFAQSYHCEATTAHMHIRVVLGSVNPGGGDSSITVIDYFPAGVGNPCSETRKQFNRVCSLNGNQPCGLNAGNPQDNVFGPNDGGSGWWDSSIYIDVNVGHSNVEGASRDAPFFGGSCAPARQNGCNDTACIGGCDGFSNEGLPHGLAYPFGFTVSFTGGGDDGQGDEIDILDLRGGVLWHMARVHQVDVATGHICFVQLVGNDGAVGECECQSFSYGHLVRANGYLGLKDLGEDLSQQEQSSFKVGQLVTVIGWTDVAQEACQATPGDWRLIVTDPHGAGQDFTSIYWNDLRCPVPAPDRNPVTKYFRGVEFAYAHRMACNGGAVSVKCDCGSGVSGGYSCHE